MKKVILTLVIVLTISLSSVSCTTDAYDAEMENNTNTINSDDLGETVVETDPVIIPKKD